MILNFLWIKDRIWIKSLNFEVCNLIQKISTVYFHIIMDKVYSKVSEVSKSWSKNVSFDKQVFRPVDYIFDQSMWSLNSAKQFVDRSPLLWTGRDSWFRNILYLKSSFRDPKTLIILPQNKHIKTHFSGHPIH